MAGQISDLVEIGERIEAALTSLAQTVTAEGFGGGEAARGAGSESLGVGSVSGGNASGGGARDTANLASSEGFTGLTAARVGIASKVVGGGLNLATSLSNPYDTSVSRESTVRDIQFSQISLAFGGQINKLYENFSGDKERINAASGAQSELSAIAENRIRAGLSVTKEDLMGPGRPIVERNIEIQEGRKAAAAAISEIYKELDAKQPGKGKKQLETVLDGFVSGMKEVLMKLESILRPF